MHYISKQPEPMSKDAYHLITGAQLSQSDVVMAKQIQDNTDGENPALTPELALKTPKY